ncbi:MAG: UDP-N-acetylglucosamine 1-carboxyvinyltransferase, partial [Gemmatimonadota bacterium]
MAQPQFIVEGGRRLSGTIRPAGNKNAALPILCAALLTDHPVTLENVPHIKDILSLVELIKQAGATAEWTGPNTLVITAKAVRGDTLDPALCTRIRGSILLAAPLLARAGEVHLAPPGGDVIGRRRLDTHFLALEALGAEHDFAERIIFRTRGLRGVDLFLDEPSVTGTENAVMAAVAAQGTTILHNAASEPH